MALRERKVAVETQEVALAERKVALAEREKGLRELEFEIVKFREVSTDPLVVGIVAVSDQ